MAGPRSVVITGSSSGFGLATAEAFAARGWRVFATMRRPEGRPAAATLAALPGVTILPLDVTDAAQRADLAAAIDAALPQGLDCLVSNAGYGALGPIEHLSEAQIARQIDTDLTGLILTTRALLSALRRARGRIIQVSSVVAYFAVPQFGVYVAAKAGVSAFGEALRYELAPHGVQVCTIEPGRHATDFNHALDRAEVPAGSVYRAGFERVLKPRTRPHGKAGGDRRVAEVILRLADMRRMPVRRPVGLDARGAWIARRLLPQALWDRIMLWALARPGA